MRQDKVYLLDFKPNTREEKPAKVMGQLCWYALGRLFRTEILLSEMRLRLV